MFSADLFHHNSQEEFLFSFNGQIFIYFDSLTGNENHFVVISLTDKSEATSVEKKVDMKDAPLVGKLKSTEK